MKKLFKALVKAYLIAFREDKEKGYLTESPYLEVIEDLEEIICELKGISKEERDNMSMEACEFALELYRMEKD